MLAGVVATCTILNADRPLCLIMWCELSKGPRFNAPSGDPKAGGSAIQLETVYWVARMAVGKSPQWEWISLVILPAIDAGLSSLAINRESRPWAGQWNGFVLRPISLVAKRNDLLFSH